MDTNTEKAVVVLVYIVLMTAIVVACTLPVWTK